jgi:PKHD-type hydroxylase
MTALWHLNTHQLTTFCYYKDCLNEEMISRVVEIGDNLEPQTAKIGIEGSLANEIRKGSIHWIPANEEYAWLYRNLTDIILAANEKYFKFDLVHLDMLQYSVYNKGDRYVKHLDSHMNGAAPGKYSRKLSFSLQLSDPSEYEGGELSLLYQEEPFYASKEKGTITFFPSYTLHEVLPVTKGTRKALVGWVSGPLFK